MANKPKVGRPKKYKEEYDNLAYQLCLLGATDATLADAFDVPADTIDEWKNTFPDFAESIIKGKMIADSFVAKSLYDKARGYKLTKQAAIKLITKVPVKDQDGNPTRTVEQIEEVKIVDLEEDLPPDTTAAIFWLKNRQARAWRDKVEVDNSVTMTKPLIIDWGEGE